MPGQKLKHTNTGSRGGASRGTPALGLGEGLHDGIVGGGHIGGGAEVVAGQELLREPAVDPHPRRRLPEPGLGQEAGVVEALLVRSRVGRCQAKGSGSKKNAVVGASRPGPSYEPAPSA